jgi:hypothetical protein
LYGERIKHRITIPSLCDYQSTPKPAVKIGNLSRGGFAKGGDRYFVKENLLGCKIKARKAYP